MNITTQQHLTDYDYGLNPLWQVDTVDDFTEELTEAICDTGKFIFLPREQQIE
jgi:hypothetical protein